MRRIPDGPPLVRTPRMSVSLNVAFIGYNQPEFPKYGFHGRNGPRWSQSWNIPREKHLVFLIHTQPDPAYVVSIIEYPSD
jgi:hypothetical protein